MDILEKKSNGKNIRYFFLHLYIYIGINLLFIIINLFVGSSAFAWITFLWGLGILIHSFFIFIKSDYKIGILIEEKIDSLGSIKWRGESTSEKVKNYKENQEKNLQEEVFDFQEDELIRRSEIEIKKIRKWVYYNIIFTQTYYLIFLIPFYFGCLTYLDKDWYRAVEFHIGTFPFLAAFNIIAIMFLFVIKGIDLRQKYSLVLIRVLLIIPFIEFLIIASAIFSGPFIMGAVISSWVLPLVFISRIILLFYFWKRLKSPEIVKYFMPDYSRKGLKFNKKVLIILIVFLIVSLIITISLGESIIARKVNIDNEKMKEEIEESEPITEEMPTEEEMLIGKR